MFEYCLSLDMLLSHKSLLWVVGRAGVLWNLLLLKQKLNP